MLCGSMMHLLHEYGPVHGTSISQYRATCSIDFVKSLRISSVN